MQFLRQFYLVAFLILTSVKFCYAQVDKNYYSTHLNENNLLNTNRIYDCAYDKFGCLWLATDAGVSRYDGIEVTNYSTDDGLPDNDILQVYPDNQGNVWMMCNNGKLCMFSNSDKRLYNSSGLSFLSWIEDGSRIANIFQTTGGEYYISTSKRTYKIDRSGSITRIEVPQKQAMSKSNFFEMKGQVYFLTSDFLVNATENSFVEHHLAFGSSLWISAIYFNNCIYTNNRDSRLIKYYPQLDSAVNLVPADNTEIQSFFIIGNRIVIASTNGIYSLSENDRSVKLFNTTNATSVCFDANHQSFALSTYDMGCIIYPDTSIQKLAFDKITTDPYVTDLYQIDSNRTLLLHSSNNFSLLDKDQFTGYSTDDIRGNRHIYSIQKFEEFVSIITERNWFTFNIFNRKVKTVFKYHNYKDQNVVLKDRLYLLSPYSLDRPSLENGLVLKSYLKVEEGNKYIDMELYHNRYLVLRSEKLFILFDCLQNKPIRFYSLKQLGLGKIFSFYIDSDNKVWLSMPHIGILRYDPDKSTWSTFQNTIKKDLNYKFYGNKNHVLAFNNNFIFKYSKEQNTMIPVIYLPSEKINAVSLNAQKLSVAVSNGILVLNSINEPASSTKDYLQMNSMQVNGVEQSIGSVQLTFDLRNQIEIDYDFVPGSYLNYTKPSYRINGYDEQWKVLEERNLTLPLLPPGKYVVEFGLTMKNGEINAQTSNIPIHILVPFWNRTSVKVIIVLLIVLVFSTIILIILRFNKLVRKKNESHIAFLKIEKKRAEAEYKAFFLQINPHFIFNTINNIKNIYNTGDPEKGNKYVQQFAKSMRNVLEFVDMNYITVEQEISYLSSYCDIFKFSIEFTYEFELESEDLKYREIPPMILQPFVENAIIHGLQNKTDGERKLKIRFSIKDEETILAEVIDNGIGRSKIKKSNPIDKTSKGLEITRRRLELLNGDNKQEEYIKFVDLTSEYGTPVGTKVQILIPIR